MSYIIATLKARLALLAQASWQCPRRSHRPCGVKHLHHSGCMGRWESVRGGPITLRQYHRMLPRVTVEGEWAHAGR